MNPLTAQLTHRPFPEVAKVLRLVADSITLAWDGAVRQAMPQMRHLSFDELKDSTPQILQAIADALASEDPELIRELIRRAPMQGLSRFRLHFDVVEVMQEDRLLRAITVEHIEAGLLRRMSAAESAALHAAVDVMLQRSVIALVEQQKSQLRAAAETELKFLSFLSHDLNNNLGNVIMLLHELGADLRDAGRFPSAETALGRAQRTIVDTVTGMRRMLDHARLGHGGERPPLTRVDLQGVAMKVAEQFAREVDAKGLTLTVDVPGGLLVQSDSELLSVVLQNLVGNAVKYSVGGGCVHVGGHVEAVIGRAVLWVSDEGPGIAPEKVSRIFEAFQRGDAHGQNGLGLGLAIASQAAKMLGAALTVESTLDVGSIFVLTLPRSDDRASPPRDVDSLASGLFRAMNGGMGLSPAAAAAISA